MVKTSRNVIAAFVTVAAILVAVVAIERSGNASASTVASESGRRTMKMVSFSQLSRKPTDLQKTFIMAAYIGPIEAPFNTVDLSGGIDPLVGRAALFAKLRPSVIPFEGMPTPFVIGTSATKGVLNAIGYALSSSAGSGMKVVGIFAIQTTTGKTAALKLNATDGKKMLAKFASHLSGGPKAAITNLELAIFP